MLKVMAVYFEKKKSFKELEEIYMGYMKKILRPKLAMKKKTAILLTL